MALVKKFHMTLDSNSYFDGSFGDLRIDKVATVLFFRMSVIFEVVLRRLAAGEKALEIAFNRLLNNEKFSRDAIMDKGCCRTSKIIHSNSQINHVLVIQDTSEVVCDKKKNPTRKGFGPMGNTYGLGFYMHPGLAVDATTGTCLGIISCHQWIPNQEKVNRHDQRRGPIENRESMRWISTAQQARNRIPQDVQVTIIADRESDIYEEWARIPNSTTHLITRSCTNRFVEGKQRLFETVDQWDVKDIIEVELNEISGKRKARTARLEVRFGSIVMQKPKGCSDKSAPKNIKLNIVDVREVTDLPIGVASVHWRLLTTHSVNSMSEAKKIVEFYQQRWHIEQLFRVWKKQGLGIESSQIEEAEHYLKVAAIAIFTACQSLQLVTGRQARDETTSCEVVFEPEANELLKAIEKSRFSGKTQKQTNPHKQGSIAWAAWIIARLGGWNGYEKSRPPGPITMRDGLVELKYMLIGWKLKNV